MTDAAPTAIDTVLSLLRTGEKSSRQVRFALREARFAMSFEGFYTMMADLIRQAVVYRRDLPKYIAPGFTVQLPHFRLPEINASPLS